MVTLQRIRYRSSTTRTAGGSDMLTLLQHQRKTRVIFKIPKKVQFE
jgi:hypothetical protein